MSKFVKSLFAVSFLLLASPATALASSLNLDPANGTFNKGCSFSLNVVLDTEGTETDGTDAIINYDPTRFTAQNIVNGPIYPDFPGNNIDGATGKITIIGLASLSTAFTGKGNLATINFTVKDTAPAGSTQMTFDFDPNNKSKTTDSNVVERVTIAETLNSVLNGNFVVGTGMCGAQSTASPSPAPLLPGTGAGTTGTTTTGFQGSTVVPPVTPSTNYVPGKTLPEAGTQELTATIAIMGSILAILGILGLALL